jgi:hypothetical protein
MPIDGVGRRHKEAYDIDEIWLPSVDRKALRLLSSGTRSVIWRDVLQPTAGVPNTRGMNWIGLHLGLAAYSDRSLSKELDILNAISGALTHFSLAEKVSFLYELPTECFDVSILFVPSPLASNGSI